MNQRQPYDTNVEVTTNANELRGSIVLDGDIEFISKQTSIFDHILIKRHLVENNNNIAMTILSLLNLQQDEPTHQNASAETTVFGEIRKILNEKELIYQEVMKGRKNT
jgi:hypothetical protein